MDLVVEQIIGEDDARDRVAELKAQRLQIEVELAALEEVPSTVTLHPATLDRYRDNRRVGSIPGGSRGSRGRPRSTRRQLSRLGPQRHGATAFPHTIQICDISSDRTLKIGKISQVDSNSLIVAV